MEEMRNKNTRSIMNKVREMRTGVMMEVGARMDQEDLEVGEDGEAPEGGG